MKIANLLKNPTWQLGLSIVSLILTLLEGFAGLLIAVALFAILTFDFDMPSKLLPDIAKNPLDHRHARRLFLASVLLGYGGGSLVTETMHQGLQGEIWTMIILTALSAAFLIGGVAASEAFASVLRAATPPKSWRKKRAFGSILGLSVFLGMGGDIVISSLVLIWSSLRVQARRRARGHGRESGKTIRAIAAETDKREETFWVQLVNVREKPARSLAWHGFMASTIVLMFTLTFAKASRPTELVFLLLVLQSLGIGYYAIRKARPRLSGIALGSDFVWVAAVGAIPGSLPILGRMSDLLRGGGFVSETALRLEETFGLVVATFFVAMLMDGILGYLAAVSEGASRKPPLQSTIATHSFLAIRLGLGLGVVLLAFGVLISRMPSFVVETMETPIVVAFGLMVVLAALFVAWSFYSDVLGIAALKAPASPSVPSRGRKRKPPSREALVVSAADLSVPGVLTWRRVAILLSGIFVLVTADIAATSHTVPIPFTGSQPLEMTVSNQSGTSLYQSRVFRTTEMDISVRLDSDDRAEVSFAWVDEPARMEPPVIIAARGEVARLMYGSPAPNRIRLEINATDLDGDATVKALISFRIQEGPHESLGPELLVMPMILVLVFPSEVWVTKRRLHLK